MDRPQCFDDMFSQRQLSGVLLNWLDVLLDFDFSIAPGFLMTVPRSLGGFFPLSATPGNMFRILMTDTSEILRSLQVQVS